MGRATKKRRRPRPGRTVFVTLFGGGIVATGLTYLDLLGDWARLLTLSVCTVGLVWTLMGEKVEEHERAKPHSEFREALRETHREMVSVPFKELVGLAYVGVIGGSSLAVLAVLVFVWFWPESRPQLYAWGAGGVGTAVVMTLPAAAVLAYRKIRAWRAALRRAKQIIKQESQQSPEGGKG